jgi:hypothetical protein
LLTGSFADRFADLLAGIADGHAELLTGRYALEESSFLERLFCAMILTC